MDIVEETFHRLEYDKFVQGVFDGLPAEREQEISELIQKYGERALRMEHYRRIWLLKEEPAAMSCRSYYVKTYGVAGVRRYETSSGHTVYRIPVLSFRKGALCSHYTNCCLILGRELTLVDCGTRHSEESLRKGFQVVSEFYAERIGLNDVANIVITHAHIDHFGGLAFLTRGRRRNIYVHRDDVWSVENIQSALVQLRETISSFLKKAGLGGEILGEFIEMYTSGKRSLEGFQVSHPVEDGDRIVEGFEVIHVPGHCPGQITLQVGDILMLGDHILMDITPHQFPKFYMKGMGLGHYIPSLLKICSRTKRIRIGLGGHNEDVLNVRGRALEIINQHHNRLADLLSLLEEPQTLVELTDRYFTEIQGKPLEGYDRILALEEVEAHMEYLADAMKCVERVPAGDGEPGAMRYRVK